MNKFAACRKQSGFTPLPKGALRFFHPPKFLQEKTLAGSAPLVRGFTIFEMLIAISILVSIILAVSIFGRDIFSFSVTFTKDFEVRQEIQLTIQQMIPEIRSIAQSSVGSYPISAAASSSLTFYSDLERDGIVEEVRYFLDGIILKKGVITPTGNPLTYNPANEIVNEVVHNMVLSASSTFAYYDSSYTGSEPPMAFPVTISDIRMIEVTLAAQENTQMKPISFSVRITPRNLRSNL